MHMPGHSLYYARIYAHFATMSTDSEWVLRVYKDDDLVRSPYRCRCEERSDAAISIFQADTNYEIASLRSQRRLFRLLTKPSRIYYVEEYGLNFYVLPGLATTRVAGCCRRRPYYHVTHAGHKFAIGAAVLSRQSLTFLYIHRDLSEFPLPSRFSEQRPG